ncbi:glycosyltransferase family 39 protein [Gammaproteobacteria bacterium]|nr:glycosyltransferase family 39 protein [Gammaproteobacteria bacterium]
MVSNPLKNIEIIIIFFIAFLFRYLFSIFSGIDNFDGPDNYRYLIQSDNILNGNFNLEEKLFITAPLFPYILAGFKWVFSSQYIIALEAFQIALSSFSVIFFMLTANLIFNSKRVALLAGVTFSVYPITFYYAHQFSQESIFQSLFVISIYFFTTFLFYRQIISLAIFSVIFSLALLTKSIILLILPFLMISLILKFKLSQKTIFHICFSLVIVFLMTLPYGLYNKAVNNSYVVASSGQGGHFLTGHNDDFYNYVTNPPPKDSIEYQRLKNMDYKIFDQLELEIEGKDHKHQQATYLNAGIKWSADNPQKFFTLVWVNIRNFLTPGFNIFHHPFHLWLLTFLISLPVFVMAYIEIIRRLLLSPFNHLAVVSIFLGMLSVALIFYTQNRYRAITIEPYYLMYFCSFLIFIYDQFIKDYFQKKL